MSMWYAIADSNLHSILVLLKVPSDAVYVQYDVKFTFYSSSIKGCHFEIIDFTSFQHSILSIRLLCTFFPLIN